MDEEEYDETYAPPKEPHKPQLIDGKRYVARISNVDVLKDQPTYNDPKKLQTVLVYTFTIDGVNVKRRITLSTAEMSNLYKVAKEFGHPHIDKTGFSGKQLVGRSCRVKVVYSRPLPDGSVFDNIDVDSIEALDLNNELDDAGDATLLD